MRATGILLPLFMAAVLAGCGSSKFKTYNGPQVTRIIVDKSDRKLFLMHHDAVLRAYNIGLGFQPEGHKLARGDGRTPEGWYYIDRRNPNSSFHLSLGISYPNTIDAQVARSQGAEPGGDIFIHGESRRRVDKRDWTAGCIAVTNDEIEELYAMVRDGTLIYISP